MVGTLVCIEGRNVQFDVQEVHKRNQEHILLAFLVTKFPILCWCSKSFDEKSSPTINSCFLNVKCDLLVQFHLRLFNDF